jgi:hypothetical protein
MLPTNGPCDHTRFCPTIVERWGGAAPFDARIRLHLALHDGFRGHLHAMSHDLELAILSLHTSRPNATTDHAPRELPSVPDDDVDRFHRDASDLTTRAGTVHLTETHMDIMALARRQPDGDYRIETDILHLSERAAGGIRAWLPRPS